MTQNAVLQIGLYLIVLLVLVKPLGLYMACIYQGKSCGLNRWLAPFERWIYRMCGVNPESEMDWKKYLAVLLVFNLLGLLAVYLIQRIQVWLPFNPQHFSAVAPDLAFNTAASFVSNTNWQAYSGESTLSYFTQMMALTVQNFLSAATGMSILVAFIRSLVRHETTHLGNFWVDTFRGIFYILIPISLVLALLLVSQGTIQNLSAYKKVPLVQVIDEQKIQGQVIPMGPVASQVAIKQLGTNGGGFFNTNSSHPFENPTPLSNFLEMLAILLIPAAICYMFGNMVKDTRQGWAILLAMLVIFIPVVAITVSAEQHGNPAFASLHIDQLPSPRNPGGNMEGKEIRFGIVNSALWASATTAASNGSVNSMHDSFTPLGGLMPLWLMQLGEVIFGGVGSGFYGMLILVIWTVFIGGLMVGRTPEYLGKKIESYEMKMSSIAILIMPLLVLMTTAVAVVINAGKSGIANPGMHGFTEILYAFTSMANNNGSAFAGLNVNTPFYNVLGGLIMLIGRYWLAIPVLAIAGSLVMKKSIPVSAGTLPTYTPLFIAMLVGVTLIVAALIFLPALALGPIVEELILRGIQ